MVKQADTLPDMDQVLKDSPFEDAKECVKGVFKSMNVSTVYDLENTPRSLTCSFCDVSTHKLIEHILAWMADPPVPEDPPAPDPEPEPEPVALVMEEVPEEVEKPKPVTPKRKGRTSSSRNKE